MALVHSCRAKYFEAIASSIARCRQATATTLFNDLTVTWAIRNGTQLFLFSLFVQFVKAMEATGLPRSPVFSMGSRPILNVEVAFTSRSTFLEGNKM